MDQNVQPREVPKTVEKLIRVYSIRRDREKPLRVHYVVEEMAGCRIFRLQEIEELE